jgi:hypothetical protein
VTYWEEASLWTDKKEWALHLVNRSPDPVSHVSVYIDASYEGKKHLLTLRELNLPPCKEMVFEATTLIAVLSSRKEVRLADSQGLNAAFLAFTDSTGRDWARGATFLKKADVDLLLDSLRGVSITGVVLSSVDPQVREVAPCGAKS